MKTSKIPKREWDYDKKRKALTVSFSKIHFVTICWYIFIGIECRNTSSSEEQF